MAAFFTFDGIDGTGKSTQATLFCEWLQQCGHEVVRCRDPGTTQLGESLRKLVLEEESIPIGMRSETLMYMAARAQLVEQFIRPSLAAGQIVVSDRFLLANVVYQAYGGQLDVSEVWRLGDFATGGLRPDKTFVLDMDVTAAAQRLQGTADRMEQRDSVYFQRVRDGFLNEAREKPHEIEVIDASRSVAQVQADIQAAAQPVLAPRPERFDP